MAAILDVIFGNDPFPEVRKEYTFSMIISMTNEPEIHQKTFYIFLGLVDFLQIDSPIHVWVMLFRL